MQTNPEVWNSDNRKSSQGCSVPSSSQCHCSLLLSAMYTPDSATDVAWILSPLLRTWRVEEATEQLSHVDLCLSQVSLGQWSSFKGCPPPWSLGDIWSCLETFWQCQLEEGTTGFEWAEVRNAANALAAHGTAPQQRIIQSGMLSGPTLGNPRLGLCHSTIASSFFSHDEAGMKTVSEGR